MKTCLRGQPASILLAGLALAVLAAGVATAAPAPAAPADEPHPPIPIRFRLAEPGFVTLVIDAADGTRVRNLVSETPFPAGDQTVWWDGLDDLARDTDAAAHSVYHVPGRLVSPGTYRVRGLVRPKMDLAYEMTPYNEGRPPWATADTSSEWLANHTAPQAALFVPEGDAPERPAGKAPGGQVIIGSYVSEGGSGIAWLDLEGRKLHGQLWIGGVWTGASVLARDEGDRPVPGVYAYTGAWWPGGGYNEHRSELRLYQLLKPDLKEKAPRDKRLGYGEDRPVLKPNFEFPKDPQWRADNTDGLGGMAVHNGLLVASLPMSGKLLFIDAAAHRVVGYAPIEAPRGLAFDRQGRLLAVSGRRILRYALPASVREVDDSAPPVTGRALTLGKPDVLVGTGLEDPRQMAFDARGNLYVSDRGQSHQVKVFGPDGKPLRAIGDPGRPAPGPYNPNHMNNPAGITISGDDHLWVTEQDYAPKRLSAWTLDGRLVKALYGPPRYGGNGSLDPKDPTLYYYAGDGGAMTLKLDWQNQTSRPIEVYVRTDTNPASLPYAGFVNMPPQTAIYLGDRKYMTSVFNTHPTNGASIGMIWLLQDGVAVARAALGRANDWPLLAASLSQHNQDFSVRWTGQVSPEFSETYTFATVSDDGARLWVDGKPLIDNWAPHGTTEDKGQVTLEAGKRYAVRMEFFQGSGGATARLLWSSPSRPKQVIPADRLFPTADAQKPGGLTAEYFGKKDLSNLKATSVDATVDFDWSTRGPKAFQPQGADAFTSRLPPDVKPGDPILFLWCDGNDDGRVQPEEVAFQKARTGGITVAEDLSFVAARVDDRAVRYRPVGFTAKGTPRYDLAKGETLATAVQNPTSSGGDQALLGEGGWTVLTVAPAPLAPESVGGVRNGVPTWSYPSPWPGLHASHIAPVPDRPGMLIGTTRLLGLPVKPRNSDLGQVWALNGNKGTVYLMTTDGLFVATLFKDCRTASWSMPKAERGMSVAEASLHEENFWPTIAQTADGQVYLVAMNGAIVKVSGLEKARRLPDAQLKVTPPMLASARAYFVESEAARQRREREKTDTTLAVPLRAAPPTVDGNLDDWAQAPWALIDQRTGQVGDWGRVGLKTEAAVAVAGDRLYAAVKADDPNLLRNAGTSLPHLFKTGGAIDLMIGTDPAADPQRAKAVAGDVRLLVARVKDKTVAVLYRPVAPGAAAERVVFASPLRSLAFDRVDDVSERVALASTVTKNKEKNRDVGLIEISVPLEVLGLKPRPGQTLRADVGVLRGNGFRTLHRVYWSNKAAGLTSDEPSEAELTPQLWGRWQFVAEKTADGK